MAKTLKKYNRKMRKSGRRTKLRKQKSKRNVKRRSTKHVKKQYGGFPPFFKNLRQLPSTQSSSVQYESEHTLACYPADSFDSSKIFKLIKSRPKLNNKKDLKYVFVDETSIKYCGKSIISKNLQQQKLLLKDIKSISYNKSEKYVIIKIYDFQDEYKFESPNDEPDNAKNFYNLVLFNWIKIMNDEILPELIKQLFKIYWLAEKNNFDTNKNQDINIINYILDIYIYFVKEPIITAEILTDRTIITTLISSTNINDVMKFQKEHLDEFFENFFQTQKVVLKDTTKKDITNIFENPDQSNDNIRNNLKKIKKILDHYKVSSGALSTDFNQYFGHIILSSELDILAACYPGNSFDSSKIFKLIKSRPKLNKIKDLKEVLVDEGSIKYCGYGKFGSLRGETKLQQKLLLKDIKSISYNESEKFVIIKIYDTQDEYKFESHIEEADNANKFYNLVLSNWIKIMNDEILPELILRFFRICYSMQKNENLNGSELRKSILEIYKFFVNKNYHILNNYNVNNIIMNIPQDNRFRVFDTKQFDPFLQLFISKKIDAENVLSDEARYGIEVILGKKIFNTQTENTYRYMIIPQLKKFNKFLNDHEYKMEVIQKPFNLYFDHIINNISEST